MDEFVSAWRDAQNAGSVHLFEHAADSPVVAFIERADVLVLLTFIFREGVGLTAIRLNNKAALFLKTMFTLLFARVLYVLYVCYKHYKQLINIRNMNIYFIYVIYFNDVCSH